MVFKVSILYLHPKMKDNILNISSQLFLEIGFKNVTMDDIAEKMGISKNNLFSLKIKKNC